MKNWAGNLEYRSNSLLSPRSTEELQEIVSSAIAVKALGSRHCFNTIADTHGIHVSLENLGAVPEIDTVQRTVRVAGSLNYGTLGAHLEKHGFALPNLASLPHISVAGAIQTGTHGSGIANGSLATAVTAIELVRASGALVRLTADDGDDFRAAVVGLGALGIITHVELAIEPSFQIRQQVFQDLPWSRVLDDYDAIAADGYSVSLFTDYSGSNIPQVWRKVRHEQSPLATPEDFHGARPATVPLHPLPGMSAENCTPQLNVPGAWLDRLPHFQLQFTPSNGNELQSEYLLPREHAGAALGELRELSGLIGPLLFISEIRTVAADDFWLSPSYHHDNVALHLTWKPLQEQVESVLPVIEERLSPYGARPHWGKLFASNAADLAGLYPHFGDFRAMAEHYDPTGKFRNDYLNKVLFNH
ncbi:D-arabinono-1,4-lactone oxidase [Arthrobacter sp. GMC3]|uniref:D-arabinono-1,4-lactone oxidase n=1 Tax=Arthrobacter sp. GMC3 TaxID=2058894 RepID=UPI000CE46FA0|nr:D-arabinono-1,4-lactone oxidase [Arthrobacter sp. GMC3]